MILAALKEHTKTLHAETEAAVALMPRLANRESYSLLIARLFGFYAPFEASMADSAFSSSLGIRLQERFKTPLLRRDLTALETSSAQVDALPRCARLPVVETAAQVFGCLYVLEGSTLGGQIIRRVVQQRLGLTPDNGCAFFAGYQEQTAASWREFGDALTHYFETHPGDRESILHSAAETFQRFGEWVAC